MLIFYEILFDVSFKSGKSRDFTRNIAENVENPTLGD